MAGTNFKVKNGLEIQSGTVIAGGGAGTSGQVLSSTGTGVQWVNAATGTGDVVGPASATDNAVVRFDGTTGKLIQNSTVTLSDTGILTVPELSTTSITSTGNNPIVIAPDGTGDVHLNADSVRIGDNNADATIATRGTGDLLLTTNEGSATEGIIRIYDGANGNITLTPNGTGQVQVGSDQVVTLTASQTLTNKTLSSNSVWNGNVIGSAYGGAGTVNGILKANGSGTVSAASAGTDYVTSVSVTSPVSNTGTTANPTIALASGYGDTQNPYGSKTANYFLATPNGSAGVPTWRSIVAADIPTLNQNTTGNAATASALQTARNINGVSFNGTADITVTAAASTLTGTTLASGVTASSLTSVGTITTGTWNASAIGVAYGGTGLTSLTAGYIPYGNGTSAFGSSANLFWDSANSRLGVGTSSPGYKLTVAGTSGSAVVSLLETGVRSWGIRAGGLATNTFDIADFTAGASRFSIDSSGNVGIGVTPRAKLETSGSIFATSRSIPTGGAGPEIWWSGTVSGISSYDRTNSAYKPLLLEAEYSYFTTANGSEQMRINNTGVGIGTTTPSQKLEVANGYALFGGLRINGADASVNQIWQSNSGTNLGIMANGGAILFGQTSSEKMRLDASGNLGIGGTASSGTRLYVVGSNTTSNTSIPIYANQVYGNTGVSSAAIRLNLNDGAGGCYLYGYSGGAGFMHNAEYLAGTGWTARSTFASIMETTSSGFSFYLNSSLTAGNTFTPSEQMRLTSTGLGIGTSSPSAPIHIQRSNDGTIGIFRGTSNAQLLLSVASGNLVYDASNGNATHVFQTNSTERMRIDSSQVKATVPFIGNSGTKGFGAVTTTTSTSTPTGGSSGDHYYIY